MKTCRVCKTEKSYEEFPKRKASKDGYRNECKPCNKTYFAKNYASKADEKRAKQAVYREKNRESLAIASNNYYHSNKDVCLEKAKIYRDSVLDKDKTKEYMQQYRKDNKEKIAEIKLTWARANKAKVCAAANKRRAAKLQATPHWLTEADWKKIERKYWIANALTEITGTQYEVDHIHPLQGKNICGLHVPENLQILTKEENGRKNNKY